MMTMMPRAATLAMRGVDDDGPDDVADDQDFETEQDATTEIPPQRLVRLPHRLAVQSLVAHTCRTRPWPR